MPFAENEASLISQTYRDCTMTAILLHVNIYLSTSPYTKGREGSCLGKQREGKTHWKHSIIIIIIIRFGSKKNKFTAKSRKVTRRYLATSFFLELRRAKEAHRRTQTSQHQKHSSRVSQSTTLRRLEVRSRNSTLIKAHSRLLQKVTTRNERWWSRGGSNSWKHTLRTSERFPKPFHPSFHRPPPPYSHSWMNEGRTREEGPYPFKSTTTTTLLHWQLERGKDTPQKMLPVSTAAIKTSPESWKALTLQTHLFPSLSRAPPAVSLAEHWRVCEANCRAQGQITAPWAHAHYRPLDVGGWHVCRHSWGGGRGGGGHLTKGTARHFKWKKSRNFDRIIVRDITSMYWYTPIL